MASREQIYPNSESSIFYMREPVNVVILLLSASCMPCNLLGNQCGCKYELNMALAPRELMM